MVENTNTPKVALVTGASSGMGKEFAKALLNEGMTVYVAARRVEQMQDLEALGARPVKLDITREEDVLALVERITAESGAVDVLINNAGFGLYGAAEDVSIDDARYQFEVNLFGLARLTQLLLPGMRQRRSGRIINISSIGGKIYTPLGSWYHATKHALEGWSDCLRLELAPFGIDVVVIEPGAIRTNFATVMHDMLHRHSAQGAYRGMVDAYDKVLKDWDGGMGSEPKVITDLVLHAVRARRPKTRYAAGKYAGTMLFVRRWFSDRMFDRMIMSTVQ